MRRRCVRSILIVLLIAASSSAQSRGTPAPTGPALRTPDGKVDFSGVWNPGTSFANIGQVPLQPWAEAIRQERRANLSKDDPEGHCLPAGVPRISPFPFKIVQTPTLIVYLDEGNVHSYRQFFLDGRGHPPDADQLWMGHSIGKWEGDTLVVDTTGFNEKTWLNGQACPIPTRCASSNGIAVPTWDTWKSRSRSKIPPHSRSRTRSSAFTR